MGMDLTGISNINEYYTNHYFSSVFEENAYEVISGWRAKAKESEEYRTPWSVLRDCGKSFYPIINRYNSNKGNIQDLQDIRTLADSYLKALGYPEANEISITADGSDIPVYLELTKSNGAPLLWVLLSHNSGDDSSLMNSKVFNTSTIDNDSAIYSDVFVDCENEVLIQKLLFELQESPRFLMIITMTQIALIDREKWNSKRYLQFELEDIYARREETTLQAMSVLLHRESICPDNGKILLDTLSDNSQRHASGVSQDLKYALRESIELLGNEVIYYLDEKENMTNINADKLTLECLRYMYRMLFVLFIEARPELGFAPIKEQTYFTGYSIESLRDIADNIREDVDEVGDGYYLHETLSELYDMIYTGYPFDSSLYNKAMRLESMHDLFVIPPLKAHIFDPEFTSEYIGKAKIRNRVMLRIIDLMSLTRPDGKKNSRRGRISYANLGINQMGAVYEALLSYRGFIAKEDLYEVMARGDKFNELDVGYFVTEKELELYDEDERVRYETGENKDALRKHKKGEFIYRLAGREREKSASYYTPECLTQCLVKYALKELLKDKTADDILHLTVCEPAMGSAAFLNEAINQLAEAYIDRKQKEIGVTIPAGERQKELQKVKMYIADNNVYGIDLNPVAVELAEVSLWLNTIYEGGYVPWFGTQLINGNSLIGARRQGYAPSSLTAVSKGKRWYESAPEKIPFERSAAKKNRIYHFLLGDPGMCSYSDKVIKGLAPEKIKTMTAWNKKFTEPYTETEITQLKELGKYIDKLWREQIKARRELKKITREPLSVFGNKADNNGYVPMSIRERDKYLSGMYKTEKAKNAGAYARLKFAMDYWCALWFWPVEKADELPERSEFLQDMEWILHGTIRVSNSDKQLTLLDDGIEEEDILETTEVDIPQLCEMFPRLAIAGNIAERNHFMHWELEFADVFADKGGFDLTIGNPPWVKLTWTEQGVLSDKNPVFAVKKLTATQTVQRRSEVLEDPETYRSYFAEYESMSGQQAYLNAIQNYCELRGQQTDLFKCFLPQGWRFGNEQGIIAFIHPDGVYSDQNGDELREIIYKRLRKHFQFINERMLFPEVAHSKVFSLNIYGAERSIDKISFEDISNLFDPSAIDECYSIFDGSAEGIKNSDGEWSIKGHNDRIIHYGKNELDLLKQFWGEEGNSSGVKLVALQTRQLLETIRCFTGASRKISDSEVIVSEMWHETYSKNDGTIIENTSFSDQTFNMICSGPHIAVGNPLYKTPRSVCREKGDYDVIDLTAISDDYLARSKYKTELSYTEYLKRINNAFGKKYISFPRLITRKMLNLKQERTFNVTVIPENYGHINGLVGIVFKESDELYISASFWSSVPFDFFVKVIGKTNFNYATIQGFPIIYSKYNKAVITRSLMLNCLTKNYKKFYIDGFKFIDTSEQWSKQDSRLKNEKFSSLTDEWTWNAPLRTDYERRQALVEIDVLTAMALGMTLEQLKTIYRIQFPVLQQYEADTWYDATGRIVFTTNRSLTGVGFDRKTWENEVKGAEAGKIFTRTIEDDTMPGGPVQRTIEYVAPFDRCDRERDYETAWAFFKEKYRNEGN